MAYRVNPETGQIEDESGNPVGAAPLDQVVGAPPSGGLPIPPAALAREPVAPAPVGPLAPTKPYIIDPQDNLPADERRLPQPQVEPLPIPGLPPAGPAPMGGKHVEGGVTTTTRTKVAPEEEAALKRGMAADEAAVGIARREGDALAKRTGAEVEAVSAEAEAAAEHAKRQAEIQGQWKAELEKSNAEVQKAVAKRAATKMEEFGENDPAWKSIGRALMIGLGELGRSLSRSGHNTALEIIRDQEKEHYMLQRQKIEDAKEAVGEAKDARAGVRADKLDALADLERERYVNNAALALKGKEMIAKASDEATKVLGEKIVNEAEQRAAASAQRYGAIKRVQVESRVSWTDTTGAGVTGATGKITDQMRERTALFNAVAPDLKLLQESGGLSDKGAEALYRHDLDSKATEKYPGLVAIGRRLPGFMQPDATKTIEEKLTPRDQQVYQAYRKAVDIANKYITGAGQTDKEFQRRFQAAVTQPGESPEVRRQKTMALVGLISEFGRQGSDPGSVDRSLTAPAPAAGAPRAAAAAPVKPGGVRKMVNGRPAMVYPDNSYDYVQ